MVVLMDSHENSIGRSRRQCLRILGAGIAALTVTHPEESSATGAILRKLGVVTKARNGTQS